MPIETGNQTGTDRDGHPPVAGRAVVADPGGGLAVLTMYAGADALAALELAPAEAVALASDLLLTARRRYGRADWGLGHE